MIIAGYVIREQVYRGKHCTVYRAKKEDDLSPVIVKILEKKSAPTTELIAAGKREYYFLRQIDSPYVINVIDRIDDKDFTGIILEDINGQSLLDKIKEGSIPVEQFLPMAIGIAGGLATIHAQNIIHRDINPSNILVSPNFEEVKIIDFDIASMFDIKISNPGNPELLQGTLPYISPEQTGRMNRKVDHRSDLYSLGVTFYKMLTGHLPFRRSNPIEIIYDHLARDPDPPYLLNDQIPIILAEIILKLMAKNPEERYQSAEGLKYDLEKVRSLKMQRFLLGEKDFSGKLQIPEKLYGRENEIFLVLDAYQRVSQGAKELILATGYSGAGKTVLFNEIHKPITHDRGFFITGKFDQLQRTIPYFAFIQALDQFCHHLLSEKKEILSRWKIKILEAVGKLGKVLTDTIPQLESIIGVQPQIPEVDGEEARKRFNHVFCCFLQTVATQEHPLVIFIDDLQWADLASLNLLQAILEDSGSNYLLLIAAYRDNELSSIHPLINTIEEIQKLNIRIQTITVKNLTPEQLREWLGDTLMIPGNTQRTDFEDLTNLIYEKTRGNAFFTIQFLENLYREHLLYFDFELSKWSWNLDKINEQNITDNVVDLLIRKIQTLPYNVQEVMKLAACIGNDFDIHTLSIISSIKQDENEKTLEIALKEHLVSPLDNGHYKFIHDRVHQAAYSLISINEKNPLHLKIGRLLLEKMESTALHIAFKDRERQIFNIVNHLNTGIALIESETEKLRLIQLNLEAGQYARRSGAYKLGADYIQTAVLLLPSDKWQQHYNLTHAVFSEAVQASYLCGDFEEMESFIQDILVHVHHIMDSSVAYEYRLKGLMAQNKPHQAVDTILSIFNRLGVDIPRKPWKFQTDHILRQAHAIMKRKGYDSIKDLPKMEDPQKQLVLKLYYMGGSAFAYAAQDLSLYVVGALTRFILKEGITPETPYILAVYGGKRVFLGDVSGAYRLAEITLNLLERGIGTESVKVRAVAIMCLYILGNKQHYKKVCALLMDTYQYAVNIGDFEFGGYLLANYALFLSRTDTEIEILHQKAIGIRDTAIQLKQSMVVNPITVDITFSSNLLGKTQNPSFLDLDIEELFKNAPKDARKAFICQANIKRIILSFLFDDHTNTIEYIQAAEESWKQVKSPLTFMKSDIYFYISLAYIQLCTDKTPKREFNKYLKKVKSNIREMKKWAHFGPVNFLHKYYLMQAELFRITGKFSFAAEYYEKAIEKAYENEYMNEAAIANELAGKYFITYNPRLAGLYLIEARNCYRKWGAVAKIKHLEEKYPIYMKTLTSERISDISSGSVKFSDSSQGTLDVKSILKASHTLSGEVQLKSLLGKMMHILIENAGAQKSFLIEPFGQELLIQAERCTDGVTGILQAIPVEESRKVPLSLVYYVAHSHRQLVFDNISKEPQYANDPYIREYRPRSVVCFPILRKGELSAIIYLENNLVEGAFTPARLEVLNMLSAQIVISMENTRLYENLEEKVRQRTAALQEAHKQLEFNHNALEESHTQINDSVNYASRIQNAVLPRPEFLSNIFPTYFVIYLPRAAVSGDFYWVRHLNEKIIVAAADCTGHGVPGALVSMLGIAFLNEIVPQLAVQSPIDAGSILNELRNKVKITLQQRGMHSEQKEGMDIALCIVDPQKQLLQFSGAYNPIYIIHNNQLLDIKGDRMPIGVYRKERPFTNHEFKYQPGDTFYLFSDGFVHQDGEGDKGAFSKRRFKNLLLEISKEPMEVQKELLLKHFHLWKGNRPQLDDVMVLGIRL